MDQFPRQDTNNPGGQEPRDFSGLRPPESMTSGTPRPTPGHNPLKFPSTNVNPQNPNAVPPAPIIPEQGMKPSSPFRTFILIGIFGIFFKSLNAYKNVCGREANEDMKI